MSDPIYSICITHYNNARTIRNALDTLLSQIDDRFELVVVDNYSTDGSAMILDEYRNKGRIKLFKRRGSRGVGREAALEKARGQYVISGLDMDDTFKQRMAQFLDFYHSKCEGALLLTEVATHIAPRDLVVRLGGYRDLQFDENWELFRRSAKEGKFRWTIFPLLESVNEHPERQGKFARIRYEYVQVRENYRVGKKPFGGSKSKIRLYQRLVQALALMTLPFYESYRDETFRRFTVVDRQLFTDSSGWWPDMKNTEGLKRKYRTLLGTELG